MQGWKVLSLSTQRQHLKSIGHFKQYPNESNGLKTYFSCHSIDSIQFFHLKQNFTMVIKHTHPKTACEKKIQFFTSNTVLFIIYASHPMVFFNPTATRIVKYWTRSDWAEWKKTGFFYIFFRLVFWFGLFPRDFCCFIWKNTQINHYFCLFERLIGDKI